MSAQTRKSAATVGQVYMPPGITPDVTAPIAWRGTAAWGYFGITALVASGSDDLVFIFGSTGQTVTVAGSTDQTLTMGGSTNQTLSFGGSTPEA